MVFQRILRYGSAHREALKYERLYSEDIPDGIDLAQHVAAFTDGYNRLRLSISADNALVGLLIEVARAEEANERDEQRVTEFPESVKQRRRHTARRVGFF